MNYFHYGPSMGIWPVLGPGFALLLILIIAWVLIWKGLALWYAARNHQKVWYIVLLIVNTLGILEIIYIIFFRKDSNHPNATHVSTTPTSPTPPSSSASS